jgi:cobalt-zinc-cadmium efflux system outer membrane protein
MLIGVPEIEAPPPDVPTDPPALRTNEIGVKAQAAVERSPLLKSLESETLYYERQRERAERDRSPPLTAILTAGRGELGDARVGGGLGWTVPVLRRNQGEIARAVAEEGRTNAERASWSMVLRSRVRADAEEYRQTLEAVGSLDSAGLPAAALVADATRAAFQAGKTELIRVINARRDLAVARSRRLDLVLSAWAAYGDLASILGDLP